MAGYGLEQGFCNVTYCFQMLWMFGALFVFLRFPELPKVHKYSFIEVYDHIVYLLLCNLNPSPSLSVR